MKAPLERFHNEALAVIAGSIADVKLGKQAPMDAANYATRTIVRKVEFLLSSMSGSPARGIIRRKRKFDAARAVAGRAYSAVDDFGAKLPKALAGREEQK